MIVLDTTVLLYAVGGDHPLRNPSADLVQAIRVGELEATTTTEVVQEFAHVRARRRGDRDEAARLAGSYSRLLAPLLTVGAGALSAGLQLFREQPGLSSLDCVLAGAALENAATALVSSDRAFAAVPGLRHVAPGTPAFAALLESGRRPRG